jgi:hypothetical protein
MVYYSSQFNLSLIMSDSKNTKCLTQQDYDNYDKSKEAKQLDDSIKKAVNQLNVLEELSDICSVDENVTLLNIKKRILVSFKDSFIKNILIFIKDFDY